MGSSPAIDWGGAVVHDGTLVVALTERPAKAWSRRFRGVLAVLDRSPGDWDAIALGSGTITVQEVREGSEDKLRHLLDSAVVEANGDLDDGAGPVDAALERLRARDLRMTEAFRRRGHDPSTPAGGTL